MAFRKMLLVPHLQADGACHGFRTRKLIMKDRCIRLVHHPETALPEPHAVVGLLVIGWLECVIETSQVIPDFSGCEQECARAVIHIAPETVHGRKRFVAASITGARAIPPDDAARFLETAVKEDDSSAHRSNVR